MVSKRERERMREYIVERLDDSGIHVAKDIARDCLQLDTTGEKNAYVFLHTTPNGVHDFVHGINGIGLNKTIYRGDFVSNIFYKDGKNFFVPLGSENKFRLKNKSMKNYTYDEICKMIVLRKKEREVLRLSGPKRLIYYQPNNVDDGGKLNEGLVSFVFRPIQSSYSHSDPQKKGYDFIMANDGNTLLERMISGDKKILNGRLRLMFSRKSPHVFTIDGEESIDTLLTDSGERRCDRNLEKYFLDQTGKKLEDFGGDIEEYLCPK